MRRTLLKRVVAINELPKVQRQIKNNIAKLLQDGVSQLKEGQAAELSHSYQPFRLKWYLKKMKQGNLIQANVRIAVRRDSRNRRIAYLLKFNECLPPVDTMNTRELHASGVGQNT